jgi:hypothetical protein
MENRGTEIHESMLVKLPPEMTANDYFAAVKRGSLFPKGALDYLLPRDLELADHSEVGVIISARNGSLKHVSFR